MTEVAQEVLPVNLEDEMRQSYLDYAMSVIVGRALPDVRDGLKPVHRRVLYAMRELGNEHNKAYKKSARVVGDVIGKYHPHGDSAVYDTIVRMAQPFSLRYLLVDGQGNFGSVDGDAPAAMRYTEVRMTRLASELLADIDKETVDFAENYDGSESEPTVLPTRVPNLLVNGSSGIAVGMATNIPPHNLGEVIDATLAVIDNEDVSIAELMEIMPGPDFPTAGIINGAQGIYSAYTTGRGRVHMRARHEIEQVDGKGKEAIVLTELPYQVNKARLIEKIAELVRDKKIDGITELRDESDKDGLRVVIELRRGMLTEVVINNLYKQTPMESVFGINMVALRDGQPRLLTLKEMLVAFVRHRREVVTRRTVYELRKARERGHVLEGQAVALANLDPVIKLIRKSESPAVAKQGLIDTVWEPGDVTGMLKRAGEITTRPDNLEGDYGLGKKGYCLSPNQAQAILELRLHRLTGLERDKIINEYKEILEKIQYLTSILQNPDELVRVIREELHEIRENYADGRRTEIVEDHSNVTIEDLIPEEDLVVTLSHGGYAKAQGLDTYQAQKRGGRGRSATKVKDEDFIDKLFVANSHDTLLCFSSRGKVYWLKVYQVPRASRGARGKPIINLLPLQDDERINAVMPVREYDADQYVFMATSNGRVKKTSLEAFSRPRTNGIIAVDLRDGDKLVDVALTNGLTDIFLAASSGKAIRFNEKDVREMGRGAAGVRGINLESGHEVIGLIIVGEGDILMATANGYGKRTRVKEFTTQGRGGKGVIAIQTSERNGKTVGAIQVVDDDEVMLISSFGTLVRTGVADISVLGRNTQGVRLIRVAEGDRLVGLDRIEQIQGEESGQDEA
ncbi:MAG: DNA gyrase subunit A [Gammaproteobacteria bacterium]|nr:DNA gyrase subunit A [Gammaproteobacteria bacterium]MCP4090865.1 DNA gyrase subunit A [Gammaproteobacteria bacterium]MCP4275527.1 DNA gyrase subunit A [Gammaproteobacteria bacterium]MCP4832249.1 DNA gyrase subunit A [Gammaproteobacteria bacterium]MCP4930303.1 DNA gyrase subunit A [Gammaproteobacteria bacterium]